jgi:cyclopropane fatty-acyl-phospholipid synthase-like methyltransferase
MAEDDIRAKYDTWHDQVHDSGSDQPVLDAPWHARAHEHLLAHVPGKAVLEIGCGRGAMSQYLLTLGPSSLYAADFSPSAVQQTKDVLSGSSATVEVEDIQALSHASSTFDTVISFETI